MAVEKGCSFETLESSNRTFMELKFVTEIAKVSFAVVLIVPLWNWNGSEQWRWRGYDRVLIVPLWNWNMIAFLIPSRSLRQVLIVPLWNWNISVCAFLLRARGSNRTFMELKLKNAVQTELKSAVLIVPLWNWNLTSDGIAGNGSTSSNRTFMELKSWDCCLHTSSWKVLIVPLWNWNWSMHWNGQRIICSNRTFMELKLP